MLEIIAIIFLCRKNGHVAIEKGLKPNTWKFYTFLAWVAAELIGITLSIAFLGITIDNLLALTGIGLMSGFGGYLFVRAILEKKPDYEEEDIDRIGVDDLQPPRN